MESSASKRDSLAALEAKDPRRRSQRVVVGVPVEVLSARDSGEQVCQPAWTEVVSAHGALLRLETPIPLGTVIQL